MILLCLIMSCLKTFCSSSPSWNWQVDNYNNQPQSHFYCTMTEVVALNQEDHSYMFNDLATPVKDCSEFRYHVTTDETNKKLEVVQSETRSILKRRRMLHFEDNPDETSLFSSENFSSILKSSIRSYINSYPTSFPFEKHCAFFAEEASPSSLDDIDLYAEEWYAECLNNAETPILSSDLNFGSLDVQVDISEYLNVPQEPEAREVQRRVIRSSPNVIFKGRNSFSRPVSNLPSSIIYPFAFIKPCGVHGDMTLKDINQRIRTPPTKPKEDEEDELVVIQTSAFSGKPVVGKTKIRTEGGKGSITIMRTKG
ncbi:unnamed protein product [Cochlearia groenlandica]